MVEPRHALTPSQDLCATLLLTHCLVGERIEGLKVRKPVARHKSSLRGKAKVTYAKLTSTSTAIAAAVGFSFSGLTSPTSH